MEILFYCSVSTGSERLRGWWNDGSRWQGTEWEPKMVRPLISELRTSWLIFTACRRRRRLRWWRQCEHCNHHGVIGSGMTFDLVPYNLHEVHCTAHSDDATWSKRGEVITAKSLSTRVRLRAKRWDVNSEPVSCCTESQLTPCHFLLSGNRSSPGPTGCNRNF